MTREEKKVYMKEYRQKNRVAILGNEREYRAKNADKIKARQVSNRARNTEKVRRWRAGLSPEKKKAMRLRSAERRRLNPGKEKASSAAWRARNKERCKLVRREYEIRNADRLANRHREYMKSELGRKTKAKYVESGRDAATKSAWTKRQGPGSPHALRSSIRSRFYMAIRQSLKTGSAIDALGCSIPEFKLHIESLFRPGMTWENRSLTGWHIDHIRPLASFDLSDPEQMAQACHFSNMQPLWASENFAKSDSYIREAA